MNFDNPKSVNVYDFDKTIYDGDSTIDFWKFCAKRNKRALLTLPKIIWKFGLYFIGINTKVEFKQTFFSFLIKTSNIDLEVSEFWRLKSSKIKEWYLNEKSNTDLVISASPEFLLKPICDELDVNLIASKVDKCTGIFDGENCHGTEKVRRLNLEHPDFKINKFYSDSLSDSPLAEISEEAFIVSGNEIIPWAEYHPKSLKNAFKKSTVKGG